MKEFRFILENCKPALIIPEHTHGKIVAELLQKGGINISMPKQKLINEEALKINTRLKLARQLLRIQNNINH